ncbi:MAG: hypothetical protein AAF604_15030 [Acidobacteriota bacterium]
MSPLTRTGIDLVNLVSVVIDVAATVIVAARWDSLAGCWTCQDNGDNED